MSIFNKKLVLGFMGFALPFLCGNAMACKNVHVNYNIYHLAGPYKTQCLDIRGKTVYFYGSGHTYTYKITGGNYISSPVNKYVYNMRATGPAFFQNIAFYY